MAQPEEKDTGMDIDEIELTLRRFASQKKDKPLEQLLNSLFTQPIETSDTEEEDGQE